MDKEKINTKLDELEKFIKRQSKHYAFKTYSKETLLNIVKELRGLMGDWNDVDQ